MAWTGWPGQDWHDERGARERDCVGAARKLLSHDKARMTPFVNSPMVLPLSIFDDDDDDDNDDDDDDAAAALR